VSLSAAWWRETAFFDDPDVIAAVVSWINDPNRVDAG